MRAAGDSNVVVMPTIMSRGNDSATARLAEPVGMLDTRQQREHHAEQGDTSFQVVMRAKHANGFPGDSFGNRDTYPFHRIGTTHKFKPFWA